MGLLELRTIDVLKVDYFAAAIVANGQSIALMDSDDSGDKVSPRESRTDNRQREHKTGHETMLHIGHASVPGLLGQLFFTFRQRMLVNNAGGECA
jgi:hypothetical protein